MTTIHIEEDAPFSVRIFVSDTPVVWQPYNPNGGAPWASKDEAETWANELALENINAGVWPPLG